MDKKGEDLEKKEKNPGEKFRTTADYRHNMKKTRIQVHQKSQTQAETVVEILQTSENEKKTDWSGIFKHIVGFKETTNCY